MAGEGVGQVRRRIVRLAVALAAVTIVIFGVPLAVGVAQYLVVDQYNELERMADSVAIAVSGDLTAPPSAPAGAGPETQTAVYDTTGVKVSGAGPDQVLLVADALTGVSSRGMLDSRLGVAAPVSDGDEIVGAVLVTAERSTVYLRIALVWLLMLALAAAALLVAWLLARRQARRLVNPLQALTTVAERLGRGDFTVRTQAVGISEIDSVNESVNRTAVRLGDLMDRERAFSADASHQLRTPLTGLRLQLEAALDQPNADLRTAIGDALTTTDRLEATIDELLALARDIPESPDVLDVGAILDGIRLRWHPVLAARGRPLRLAVFGTPHARVGASALTQILDVLIDNADQHGTGAITVTVRTLDDAVAIDVADEGSRLLGDPAVMFERRTGPATGHGIGLALARRLAEAQGGRLRLATPEPPTFTLLLPPAPSG
jgi:signal transduction histidine kinase